MANVNGNHSGDPVFNCFPELTAGDVDEAADVVTRVFLPATVDAIGRTRLDLRLNVVQLPALTAGQLHFGADVNIQIDEVSDYYIDVPLTGQAFNRWRDGRLEKTSAGTAAVFSPGTPCDLGWSADCQQVCIKVTQPEMQRQLEAMLNHPAPRPIVFSRRMEMKATGPSGWLTWYGSSLVKPADQVACSLIGSLWKTYSVYSSRACCSSNRTTMPRLLPTMIRPETGR